MRSRYAKCAAPTIQQTPEIVAHATSTIPILCNHLQMVLGLAGQVGAGLSAT